MAVTGFAPFHGQLGKSISYVKNPRKTERVGGYQYGKDPFRVGRVYLVRGINCSVCNVKKEMEAVPLRFGKRGKVVGYHGMQSFEKGEVTPEEALEIGMLTAWCMWGERFQVLVAVHMNTDQIHCHFVVNAYSFVDGEKFPNQQKDHMRLREISDDICRERGKSVQTDSDFYTNGTWKEYWIHKKGGKTKKDLAREDIGRCIMQSECQEELTDRLREIGYEFDPEQYTVRAIDSKYLTPLSVLGFRKEDITGYFRKDPGYSYDGLDDIDEYSTYPLLERNLVRFVTEEAETKERLLPYFITNAGSVFSGELEGGSSIICPNLRHKSPEYPTYWEDGAFLLDREIMGIRQLENEIQKNKDAIEKLKEERNDINRRLRKAPEEDKWHYEECREDLTEKIRPIREELKREEKILEYFPKLFDGFQLEYKTEQEARERRERELARQAKQREERYRDRYDDWER